MSIARLSAGPASALLTTGALLMGSWLLTAGVAPAFADETKTKKAELKGIPVEGYKQLMPRGGIPALVDPDFVSASEAEIPDEAWILGFERDGEAFAYDLNLLNSHEVVNHGTESGAFAAVW